MYDNANCDICIHAAVCSIFRATGGVKRCNHFKGEENLFNAVCNALASTSDNADEDK